MAGWKYERTPGRGGGGQKSLWTCLLQADLPAPFVQQYTLAGFGCTKYNFDGIESDTIITASIINKEEITQKLQTCIYVEKNFLFLLLYVDDENCASALHYIDQVNENRA